MKEAIVDYGLRQEYALSTGHGTHTYESSSWQFEALADIFKPICYQRGSCQFNADVDRACSIKDRVEANARVGTPSSEWHKDRGLGAVLPIHDKEWMMDPSAARVSQ